MKKTLTGLVMMAGFLIILQQARLPVNAAANKVFDSITRDCAPDMLLMLIGK